MPNKPTAAPRQGNQTAASEPAQAYTILVKVYAPTQADAFSHIEQAIEEYIERRTQAIGEPDVQIHVSTQDGTRATQF